MRKTILIFSALLTGLVAYWVYAEMGSKKEMTQKATFAGGCFWCMEPPFENQNGVTSVRSGYTGGKTANPTYEEVSKGQTGHAEAVEVVFDPNQVRYQELVEIFWRNVNPTQANGQFVDKGTQYRTAIFYHNDEQKRIAETSKEQLAASGKFNKPIVTQIVPATKFYPAEDYHQDYHKKLSGSYKGYRAASGRDSFIEKVWGKEKKMDKPTTSNTSKEDLKKKLTPMQYDVTQQCGTEPPFRNEYWDNHRKGIYVDIVSGEALFASTDKFDSGTGWPSFTKPIEPDNVIENEDETLGMSRTEVKSKKANSHLGHVFPDGPGPKGLRYCINSASLRFVAYEDLEKEGYGKYKTLFSATN